MTFWNCVIKALKKDASLKTLYNACEKKPGDTVACLKKIPAFSKC
jgi:hypothetical protein